MGEVKAVAQRRAEVRSALVQIAVCLVAVLLAQLIVRPAMAQDATAAGGPPVAGQVRISGPAGSELFGQGITVLTNGNFVIADPGYDTPTRQDVGRVALYDGKTFKMIAAIFGERAFTQIGIGGVDALTNGNYVIHSPFFDEAGVDSVGAVTWCSGTTGCTGQVRGANSLIGSSAGDAVGSQIVPLRDGGYLALSHKWDNAGILDAGAITRCPAEGCIDMVVSPANSLVGSSEDDELGAHSIALLDNGDYVVRAPNWDNGAIEDVGAVIRCPAAGCVGTMDATNALIGSKILDQVGFRSVMTFGTEYVVASPFVDLGVVGAVGAVTYCKTACTGSVSALNSFMGTSLDDNIGLGGIHAAGEDAYVILSPNWDSNAASDVGAVTFCLRATPCAGFMLIARSLVGSSPGDYVGAGGVTVLSNGNYVVISPLWQDGGIDDLGALTWCSGETGCVNQVVSAGNSLHGSSENDRIGENGAQAVGNGAYVVTAPSWDAAAMVDVGAVAFCSGATGCTPGPVSSANSLVGVSTLDQVGLVAVLANGNYVVYSSLYNGPFTDGGKAVLCSGSTGCSGSMADAPGLEASHVGQNVGWGVVALADGNFIVRSNWTRDGVANVGAVTWCSGTTGCPSTVNSTNSMVGTLDNDQAGSTGLISLANGGAAIKSDDLDFDGLANVGAVSVIFPGGAGLGAVSLANSVIGEIAGAGPSMRTAFNPVHAYQIVGLPVQSEVVILLAEPSLAVINAGNGSGTVTSDVAGIDCGSDCHAKLAVGTTIKLSAQAAENSNFMGWSGACTGMGACEVKITAGHAVTATFAVKMLEVIVAEASTGGAIDMLVVSEPAVPVSAAGDDGGVIASGGNDTYFWGTLLEFTAVPDPGYIFVRWINSLSGSESPLLVTVTDSMTIGAIFSPSDIAEVGTYLPIISR